MVWTGRFELPISGSRSRRSPKLSYVQMSAESGSRTRTPLRGTGLSTRRVYRSTISADWAAGATRASSGCRPPPPPVRTAGTRRRRRRANPYWATMFLGWCGRRDLHSHAPEGTGFWDRHVCIPSLPPAADAAARASPGCRPPDPAVQRPGARRGGRHSADGGTCTPTPFDGAPGFGPGVSAFHHVGRSTVGGSAPVVVVPRTGIEPVISSLRGRRVGHSTNGALQPVPATPAD